MISLAASMPCLHALSRTPPLRSTRNPTYETVCGGDGHTEALRVWFDPATIPYEKLLEVRGRHVRWGRGERGGGGG